MTLGLLFAIEHIIHYEVETCGEVRHITAEGLIRVDRNQQTIQVQTVVRLKELLHVGIFVTLHLSGGETIRHQALKGLVAHGIHHVTAVLMNHRATLLVQVNILLFATHYSSPISSLIQS